MPNYFETSNSPILAADFHYFRLPREKWELMLIRLRQMGVNTLTLTLPWGFHEFEQGTIDLAGATHNRRDIIGLLKLSAALNFTCILNPGPYSHDGVLGNGLPLWLLKQADDLEAAPPEAAANWYKAMSQALTDQQWPTGPIIALHLESERGEANPFTLSKQLTEVKWRIWLRKRYEGIEALNAAYGTDYRTVNEVKFPESWSAETTPLETDAKLFLETVRRDTQTTYRQILVDSGWQIPIYPSDSEINPALQIFSLTNPNDLADLSSTEKSVYIHLNLQQPIQIDPDPIDIGRTPVWAKGAPIRHDGSLREKFWRVRQSLWSQTFSETRLDNQTLVVSFPSGSVVTCNSETTLKIDLPIGAKSAVYRLRLSGELVIENKLRVSRGKLSGLYLAEDFADQTDLVFILNNLNAPLSDFPLTYLSHLLTAQAHTLARCATLATTLSQTLNPTPADEEITVPEQPVKTSYILGQARRGLSEADAALRKALTSISELEGGFASILGKSTPQPANLPATVSPAIFEGQARAVLAEVGAACAKIGPTLQSAADGLHRTLESSTGFTVEQYQQNYTAAITAARTGREPLLEVIGLLRLEIASERLPLVVWRIHNQVQEIAESLRWGVLRS